MYEPRKKPQVIDLINLIRTNPPKLQQKKVNSLIILDVHARDVVDRWEEFF
jgi:hypothetical protein